MSINVRTDLASEARRIAQGDAGEMTALQGVEAHEETLHGFGVTAVEILDDIGAQQLNKPVGKYFTLELPSFTSPERRKQSRSCCGAACPTASAPHSLPLSEIRTSPLTHSGISPRPTLWSRAT